MLGVPSALSRAISVLCCMEGGMASLGVQTLLLGLTGKRFSCGEGGEGSGLLERTGTTVVSH